MDTGRCDMCGVCGRELAPGGDWCESEEVKDVKIGELNREIEQLLVENKQLQAEADPPLRKGDRVQIGDVEAFFVEPDRVSPEFCWVDYTGSSVGMTHRVPVSVVTR